ncbi:hypothetical protein FRC03_011064 [Tulasnella sp. 419]|nr:hypothetical protein FRC03_011064 [Tulasnella sp. 419]
MSMSEDPYVDIWNPSALHNVQYFDFLAKYSPWESPTIANPVKKFDYKGYGETKGYLGFGRGLDHDRKILRRMVKRALDRYEAEGHHTVYVFMWLKPGDPPVVAERVVFQQRGWYLGYDRDMLHRLGKNLPFKAEVTHLVPVQDQVWRQRSMFFEIETPLPGGFILMATKDLCIDSMPYLRKIQAAFETNFSNSVEQWISERVSEEDAARESLIKAIRAALAALQRD